MARDGDVLMAAYVSETMERLRRARELAWARLQPAFDHAIALAKEAEYQSGRASISAEAGISPARWASHCGFFFPYPGDSRSIMDNPSYVRSSSFLSPSRYSCAAGARTLDELASVLVDELQLEEWFRGWVAPVDSPT